MKLAQVKTKKEAVAIALRKFVQNRKRRNLVELKGKIKFAEGYDYKSMRNNL